MKGKVTQLCPTLCNPISPGEGNGNPIQCSYLENPMDRGARWTTVQESDTTEWLTLSLSTLYSGILQTRNTGVGSLPPPGDLPNPGMEPGSPALKANSLPPEPPRKPKNTGVGSLSLLQGVFSTQESNRGLLHCRWRYQGSPTKIYLASNVNRVEIQKLCSRGYVRTQLILNTAL